MSESAPRPKGRWLLRHLIIDFWMGIPKAVLRSPTAFANGFQWCSARARSTAKELLAGSTFFVLLFVFFYLVGAAAALLLPSPFSSSPDTAIISLSRQDCFKAENRLRASQASEEGLSLSAGGRMPKNQSPLAPWLPARPSSPADPSPFCHADSAGFYIALRMEPFVQHPMLALDPRSPTLKFPMDVARSMLEDSGASLSSIRPAKANPSVKLYLELIGASPPTEKSRPMWTSASFPPPSSYAETGMSGQISRAILHHGVALAGIGFFYSVATLALLSIFRRLYFVFSKLTPLEISSTNIKNCARNIARTASARLLEAPSRLKISAAKMLRTWLRRSPWLLPFLGLSFAAGISSVAALYNGNMIWTQATRAECFDVKAHAALIVARNAEYVSAMSCRFESSGPIVVATKAMPVRKTATSLTEALSDSIVGAKWEETDTDLKSSDFKTIAAEIFGRQKPTGLSRPLAHIVFTQLSEPWPKLALTLIVGALLVGLGIAILVFCWRALRIVASWATFIFMLARKTFQALLTAFWSKASDAEFLSRAEFRELAKKPKSHSLSSSGKAADGVLKRKSRRL